MDDRRSGGEAIIRNTADEIGNQEGIMSFLPATVRERLYGAAERLLSTAGHYWRHDGQGRSQPHANAFPGISCARGWYQVYSSLKSPNGRFLPYIRNAAGIATSALPPPAFRPFDYFPNRKALRPPSSTGHITLRMVLSGCKAHVYGDINVYNADDHGRHRAMPVRRPISTSADGIYCTNLPVREQRLYAHKGQWLLLPVRRGRHDRSD